MHKKIAGEPMEELYSQLAALARRYGAKRLVLFGSRARGDNRYNSDIDLAVYGMPEGSRSNFWMDCEDLPTLLKFDIVPHHGRHEPRISGKYRKGRCNPLCCKRLKTITALWLSWNRR